MPFVKKPQVYSAKINALTLGTGDKAIVLGGQNVNNLYAFDGEIVNRPKVGIDVSDIAEQPSKGLAAFYEGCTTLADRAKKAAELADVDFVCIRFDLADPNGANKSVEECVADAKAVAEVVDKPIVVAGCKNAEKDAELLSKVSEALQGKNILVLSAKEENYKGIAAGAGLAYGQKIGAESAVDINLAKQVNVLITQMGINGENIAMNIGSAAAGYGFE
ncbi:MAG: acetyl-CoA synthase subunit delta, partial [Oscillospiraceae bacterium]|nr:acetyl-CoA synthase subunit delta [Oscillospiraceae bacterium]